MLLFLKSINQDDKNICKTFLPEIQDTTHKLYSDYTRLQEEMFKISKRVVLLQEKNSCKENRARNRKRVPRSNYKSLLNSAKFLKTHSSINEKSRIDKRLYSLSRNNNYI